MNRERCKEQIWPSWSDRWITCQSTIRGGRCVSYGHRRAEGKRMTLRNVGCGHIHVAGPKVPWQNASLRLWAMRLATEMNALVLEGPPQRVDATYSWVYKFPAAFYWHEVTNFADLARGQRVYITLDGTTVYEPANRRSLTAG